MGLFGIFKKKKTINPYAKCLGCGRVIYYEEGTKNAIINGYTPSDAVPIVACPNCNAAYTVSLQRHPDNNIYMYLAHWLTKD